MLLPSIRTQLPSDNGRRTSMPFTQSLLVAQDHLANAISSPRAIAAVNKLQIGEACLAILLLPVHIAVFVFTVEDAAMRPGVEIWILCSVPFLLSCLRLPLGIMYHVKCQQVLEREQSEEASIEELLVFFCSPLTRYVCAITGLILLCFCCCLIWGLAAQPCSKFSEMMFWEMGADAIPCETFSFTCALLCCVLTTSFTCRMLWPTFLRIRMIWVDRARAAPPPRAGLSESQLAVLPQSVFGDIESQEGLRADDEDASSNTPACSTTCLSQLHSPADAANGGHDSEDNGCCSICLEPFCKGQNVRLLPCKHLFHLTCVDGWLARTASCPLRCDIDLAQEVQKIQASRGVGSSLCTSEAQEESIGTTSPDETTFGRPQSSF
eukprot:TRINITY_DN23071_c0_g1_i2.p1 TRINITY_DN23071_c0_g1~~TRINITY_DN23071_c0_g1_i2.p1  ORF type:complete len:380 (-),score=52.59 TRINITY_DN23071_c0_g1_i2:47-1186(-)